MTEPEEQQPPLEEQPAPPRPESYPFWSYKDLLLLIGMAVPIAIGAAMLVGIVFYSFDWTPHAKALGPVAAQFIFYAGWFFLLYELIHLRYNRPFWRSLRWVSPGRSVASCVAWGILTAFVSVLLGMILRPPEMKTPLYELLKDPGSIVLIGVFAVTLGPLCEELAFRGLLMPLLVRSFGAVAGILLQALPFALLHGAEYAWSWKLLLPIFVAGAAFGWIRYTTGSTIAAVYMHAAYNLTFFVGLIAQRFAPGMQR